MNRNPQFKLSSTLPTSCHWTAGDEDVTVTAGDEDVTVTAGDEDVTVTAGDEDVTVTAGDEDVTVTAGDQLLYIINLFSMDLLHIGQVLIWSAHI
jgi:ferric-dicitrate binding protein FerR (iron transport regulator)